MVRATLVQHTIGIETAHAAAVDSTLPDVASCPAAGARAPRNGISVRVRRVDIRELFIQSVRSTFFNIVLVVVIVIVIIFLLTIRASAFFTVRPGTSTCATVWAFTGAAVAAVASTVVAAAGSRAPSVVTPIRRLVRVRASLVALHKQPEGIKRASWRYSPRALTPATLLTLGTLTVTALRTLRPRTSSTLCAIIAFTAAPVVTTVPLTAATLDAVWTFAVAAAGALRPDAVAAFDAV